MNKVDKRFAEKIGAEYALFPLAAPHYEECQKLIAELTAHHSNQFAKILELGCGTGLTTQHLQRHMPHADITALDAEEVMITQAQQLGLGEKVRWVCADALAYLKTIEDGSLSGIVTAFCFHNTKPKYRQQVFKEMGRVLRHGGIIVVGDKIAQDDVLEHWMSLREQIDAFSVFQDTEYPELQAEWTAHYLQDDRIRLTESEQRSLFKMAGCSGGRFYQRWRMDAVFFAIKG